jgi:4-hydroxybenzoate polyprenyltransferase
MFRTVFLCLVFFLLGVAGASFYWIGYMTENSGMKSVAIMLSGIMLLVAILTIAVIKAYEDREKDHEGL